MKDVKDIEQKIRDRIKSTETIPLIYTDPSDDFRMYHGAEAYLTGSDKLLISVSGSDTEYTLDSMVNEFGSEIYMADLGDRLT